MKKLIGIFLLSSQLGFGQGLENVLEIAPHAGLNTILGISILGVGDVNGDGWPDLAVGAYGVKKTFFYWGGPGILDTVVDFVLPYVGSHMVLADINGDGKKDLILMDNNGYSNHDSVLVFFGRSAPPFAFDTMPDITYRFQDSLDVGWNSFAVGDLNGDGYDDLILGAETYGGHGRVYVYMGKPVPSNIPNFTVKGDTIAREFGYSIQTGDINGDGYTDLAVASLGYQSFGVDQRLETWLGGQTFRFEKDNYHQRLNASALGRDAMFDFTLIDFNLDGKTDLSYPDSGKALFHWGGDVFAEQPNLTIPPNRSFGFPIYFSRGSQPIGDVNGDGLPDFAFQGSSAAGYSVGVYLGARPTSSSKPVGTRGYVSSAGTTFLKIVPVGDINGDGVNDFASSAPYDDYAGLLPQPGYVVILSGNKNWITSARPQGAPFLPSDFTLAQNYPNPFNPSTTIRYTLPKEGHVRLRILDQLGREVITLVNGKENPGEHSVIWSGRGEGDRTVGSGVYFYQLSVDGSLIQTRKLVLLK